MAHAALNPEHRPIGSPTLAFTIAGEPPSEAMSWLLSGLRRQLEARGHEYRETPDEGVGLVIHVVDAAKPRSFRRRSQAVFVLGVTEVNRRPDNVLSAGYPILIRSLSNLLLYVVNDGQRVEPHFVTLEQGAYPVSADLPEEKLFEALYERVAPLATSRLVINNIFEPDLPEELWNGDELTEQLRWAGKKLDEMNLLPAPFPIQELLSEDEWRHVQRLYSLGGLSYGNLSIRKDATRFWMSGSGVNKADLRVIGRDILLVKDYDEKQGAMVLSVPPHVKPNRVSVDAIEHWMIYREHPNVGAIVHVHAWMENIPSTEINYPCGTYELAHSVAQKVREAPDPSRAVVGLRNHGLTITGHSLEDIFARIEGRIIPQVPMT
ncbi:MAG: class II aldolase/adducin family protein [Firmicutes bacterium]|nr:class II aldolase/adducin family protein [Bacillota bacterium]